MKEKLRALCRQYDMLPTGAVILCAVSGGADSMCLLHLLDTMSSERGFSLRAAHFNHNLRGDESLRDEAFVRTWCRERDIPFTCGSEDVAAEAVRTGRGIEETARSLRYAFLERTAKELGAVRIATAHTANDNAETMLLHLVRGSGLQGLTGIPPRRGNVVRPLLTATRAEVEEYCARHGVRYIEDSTNGDERYTRNFLRRRVMPLLEQVNPRVTETLSAAADRLRVDNDYLAARAAKAANQSRVTPDGLAIKGEVLADLPDAIAGRVVRQLMEKAGGGANCTAAHINALLALSHGTDPSARVDLPGLTARRMYGELVLTPGKELPEPPRPAPVQLGERIVYGETGWSVTCRQAVCPETSSKKPDTFFFSCDKIKGALILRPRQTGDIIKLPGRGTKTVKKLLIDEKIPLVHRELLPVLADDAGVLAVASFGPDVSRLAQPGEASLAITFEKE